MRGEAISWRAVRDCFATIVLMHTACDDLCMSHVQRLAMTGESF